MPANENHDSSSIFIKIGHPRPVFGFLSSFQTNITTFNNKVKCKNVQPIYSAGVQTHDLLDMSLLP